MRGRRLTLSALLAAALLSMQSGPAGAGAPPAKTEPVAYRLSPELDGAGALTALKVEIRFREGPSGQTRLAWTKEWAGDSELSSHARDMKISGGEATADGPGAWVIRAAPGAPITASYRVVSAYDHDPTDEDSKQSKPVVRPIWFYAVGEALFAAPQGQEKSPATFIWDGAPKDFGFASDLEHLARPGSRAAARAGTVDDVIESIVVGGRDLRTFERRYNGARVRVAMMGRYGFDDAAFANQVFQVLRVERDFWKDRASPFLVTMSPTLGAPGRISYGGTGRADAFALWVDTTTKMDGLRWLLAHEYFHTWNPKQLGDLGDESVEAAGYWFSEGFTDYYAWELMRRSHQFAPEAFAGQWNSMLRAYAVSPVRDKPNSLIVSDFWTSQAVQKLPYQRGAILAAVLERQARAHGTSLDAVLLEMRRLAARPGETRHADVLFPVAYRSVVGADLGDLLARHIVAGEPLALPADAFGRCFQIKTVEIAPFERGWDSAATRKADNVVTGLRDDSPAYAAGLRNGMKIIEFLEGDSDNSTVAVLLKVQPPEGPERLVRFFPAGKTRLPAQQLEPVPGCKG